MSAVAGPLYIGFDLSTQQLKAIVISSDLKVHHQAKVDFDHDFGSKYGIKKGVKENKNEHEVYAPVALWLESVDLVLSRLKDNGAPLGNVKGISGACQQHGSVYWSTRGEEILASLEPGKPLVEQLSPEGFAHPWSPNWQDASTQKECDAFDAELGDEDQLSQITGSKAHHRFTGPQIMRIQKLHPEVYEATSRISLVSSFLASVLSGKIQPMDISDVCGANLWDIKAGKWNDSLLELASGKYGKEDLRKKLGEVPEDGGGSLGSISDYFVERYGFSKDCSIAPFTGDNPSTILALPLRSGDAMVSLGTSTTFLMSTPHFLPDPAYHFFNHPTTAGLYMFMLCYKNGGLAREKVRDELPKSRDLDPWSTFNDTVLNSPLAGQKSTNDASKIGLYFPLPEIVPNVHAGTWRYNVTPSGEISQTDGKDWTLPGDDARTIVESQVLSLRLRSRKLVQPANKAHQSEIPAQPRRVYVVGGGALNPAITQIIGSVLGGTEGVYRLDVGGNACALGGAYKAVWALERGEGESFEDLIGERWRESEAVEKVDVGYREDEFSRYGKLLEAFETMEGQVLKEVERDEGALASRIEKA